MIELGIIAPDKIDETVEKSEKLANFLQNSGLSPFVRSLGKLMLGGLTLRLFRTVPDTPDTQDCRQLLRFSHGLFTEANRGFAGDSFWRLQSSIGLGLVKLEAASWASSPEAARQSKNLLEEVSKHPLAQHLRGIDYKQVLEAADQLQKDLVLPNRSPEDRELYQNITADNFDITEFQDWLNSKKNDRMLQGD